MVYYRFDTCGCRRQLFFTVAAAGKSGLTLIRRFWLLAAVVFTLAAAGKGDEIVENLSFTVVLVFVLFVAVTNTVLLDLCVQVLYDHV